jgi:hypothetical protein
VNAQLLFAFSTEINLINLLIFLATSIIIRWGNVVCPLFDRHKKVNINENGGQIDGQNAVKAFGLDQKALEAIQCYCAHHTSLLLLFK